MKRMLPYLPALAVLIAGLWWYLRGAQAEVALQREWDETGFVSEAVVKEGTAGSSNRGSGGAARLLTPQQTETLMAQWTAAVLAEEQRLVDTGEKEGRFPKTQAKFAPWLAYLQSVPAADLLTICLTARDDSSLTAWMVNVRSSEKEIRSLLAHAAYEELLNRDPFLALKVPQNDPATKNDEHYGEVLTYCAKVDRERAWKAVQEKYGGVSASVRVLNGYLAGACGPDIAARIDLARNLGFLDRMAGRWAAGASQSQAGQQAWLKAMREVPPADAEVKLVNFAGEVEMSEGFAGVQRIVDQIAAPGTPLYDRVLRGAVERDLEEGAGGKADWILARVSAAEAPATAEALMKHWAETDPLAASEWLDKVPKSAGWRKAAVLAFAKAIEFYEPEAAGVWRKPTES